MILSKIQEHHKENGGMSRYKKIPIYLEWNGIYPSTEVVAEYEKKFAELVIESVISSAWIGGVEKVIRNKNQNQKFVIITGTPQEEIEIILERLNINTIFDFIFGAPMEKTDAIRETLKEFRINKEKALMIGDSRSDFVASMDNGINFLFRDSGEENEFSKSYDGPRIQNFEGMI